MEQTSINFVFLFGFSKTVSFSEARVWNQVVMLVWQTLPLSLVSSLQPQEEINLEYVYLLTYIVQVCMLCKHIFGLILKGLDD